MNDLFDLFAEPAPEPEPARATPMNDSQRTEIRTLFGTLDKVTAGDQFAVVDELIGIHLTSVVDLTAIDASRLIQRLRMRVDSQSRTVTDNSWADRDEDTWIDRL